MLRDLEYLVQLQEIDLRIREQELAKEQLPATVLELEKTIERAKKSADAAAARLAEKEGEVATFEEQIAAAQDGLSKSQERLNAIRTNREYDAVHAEIEAQKGMIASSENRKKRLAEEIEQLKSAADAAAQEFEGVKTESEPKIAELTETIAKLDSVIASITEEREAATSNISKATLRTYNQILSRRKQAKVISHVNEARTCTVCFKMLEPQLMSEIRRSTKIITCQNCGSIFVWTGAKKNAES